MTMVGLLQRYRRTDRQTTFRVAVPSFALCASQRDN